MGARRTSLSGLVCEPAACAFSAQSLAGWAYQCAQQRRSAEQGAQQQQERGHQRALGEEEGRQAAQDVQAAGRAAAGQGRGFEGWPGQWVRWHRRAALPLDKLWGCAALQFHSHQAAGLAVRPPTHQTTATLYFSSS